MISFVLFSVGRAWQGFWRNAVMSLAATATMVLMLLLLAGFWIIQTGLLAGLQFTEQKVEVVAYLQPNATDSQVTSLQAQLKSMPEVASVAYVDRDEALVRFRASMQAQGREDLTRYLDANPLYASIEVKMVDPSQVRVVGDALRGGPERPQRHQHRGPRGAGADGDEHPADRGDGRPRDRRRHRPVHHHQHDPPGGPGPGGGDRGHAPRRRVGRVHPLAVRVRGRLRRAPRVGAHAGDPGRRRRPA